MYVQLIKVKSKAQANKIVKQMGWHDDDNFREDTGDSLVGYWTLDLDKDEEFKQVSKAKGKKGKVRPIAVVTGGRMFKETLDGYISKNYAYVEEEKVESLF